MYLRKSSEAEDRQQLSIPAQERELRELATRQGLVVIGEPIAEAMSAKRPGRPGFAKLMDMVTRRQADGVLVWALDRLARNPVDGGAIMWSLGEGQIRSIVAPDRTYTGSGDDKLLMSIMFGMATKYSDDLSKNVKRGNRQALLNGHWPNRPKIGYLRATDGTLQPDPERWRIMCDMWSMRLAGRTALEILDFATEYGLRTPRFGNFGGRKLTMSEVCRIFNDPFYTGKMPFAGELHDGLHKPMVTLADFDLVQAMTKRRESVPLPTADEFRYRKLLRCGACGARVTPELTINRHGARYLYYHCARKDRRRWYCGQPTLEQRKIDEQLADFFGTLQLPGEVIDLVLAELDSIVDVSRQEIPVLRAEVQHAIDKQCELLANLRLMRAADEISASDFASDQARFLAERRRLEAELARLLDRTGILEPLRKQVFLLNRAKDRFKAADNEKKREFVDATILNLNLKDKKLLITAKEPLGSFARLGSNPSLRRERDLNPRYLAVYRLSKAAHSATMRPLQCFFVV